MARKLTVEESLQYNIAHKLSNYLYAKQMTQKEFADKVGVSAPTVSAWCNGTKSPRLDKIDRICEVLNISRADLMGQNSLYQTTSKSNPIEIISDQTITMEDIRLAQQIHRLDEYRRRLIKSIIATEPEQKERGH